MEIRKRALFIIVVLLLVCLRLDIGHAQPSGFWTPPQRIPGFSDSVLPPYMIADHNQTVHAFSSDWIEPTKNNLAILYTKWTLEGSWTLPNDILLPPFRNQAWVQGVYLSPDGYFHLIFFGGDDREARIYYTKAPADRAWDASAWNTPIIIGDNARTPRTTFLIGKGTEKLVVAYSSDIEGNGLYVVYSEDKGNTWTSPEPIFLTLSDDLFPSSLDMYLGNSGIAHAVWNVVDPTGANISGHYARLNVESRSWSLPIMFDKSIGLGIAIPTVIEFNDQVIMMYNNGISGAIAPVHWMRVSTDGGVTWLAPQRAFPSHIGRNGLLSLVVDASQTLHVFFGQRTYGSIHGMWHSIWEGGLWGTVEPVVSGPMVQGTERGLGFDPYDARAVVVQGNVLLATWRTDPGNSRNGIWYSTNQLNLPPLPLKTMQAPAETPHPALSLTPLQNPPELTPAALEDGTPPPQTVENSNPGHPMNPTLIIIYAAIPVIIIVIGFVLFYGYRAGYRY